MGWFTELLGIMPKKPPEHVGDENFVEVVMKSDIPVILDVWGPNCGPCKKLEPIIMQLAAAYDGRIRVCEMNAADAPRTAGRLRVRGTPTVIYFGPRGQEKERVVGLRGSLYHEQTVEELFGIPKSPA
jgi:thioredoxin 1